MLMVKTKEAAEALEVSQTTVKRWASRFPFYFRKDRNGHYMFSEDDMAVLFDIKRQIESGVLQEQLVLPAEAEAVSEAAETAAAGLDMPMPSSPLPAEPQPAAAEDLLQRIRLVERTLTHKADEVATVQLLEHRRELDELRQSVERLAAAVESLQKPVLRQQPAVHDGLYGIAAGLEAPSPSRRRGLRRFIPFWSYGKNARPAARLPR